MSLKDWMPLPSEEQFSLEFIKNQGALVLKADGNKLTIGITQDNPLLRKKLHNFLPNKELIFLSVESQELSIYLADLLSISGSSATQLMNNNLNLEKLEGDAPLINLVNGIILDALRQGASDIHIEIYTREVSVRFRLDGILKQVRTIPREFFSGISSRIKIMANLNIMERRLPQDGRISVETGGESVDLRVSIVPVSRDGESIVLRLLNRRQGVMDLEDMGFCSEHITGLRNLIKHPHGLILVTGPTGSGKTTTLNGILRAMVSREKKIITIEDPIEFQIDGINQIQTHADIGLTFSSLLRRVLRQDPNIIMVGEIRDSETAELAVRAALTGHLVFSTLHTNDALSVVPRLTDMGVEAYLLAAVLKGALAQRLVRILCDKCKKSRIIDPAEKVIWHSQQLPEPQLIWESVGCGKCNGTGFKGRSAISELFLIDLEMEAYISRGINMRELVGIMKKQQFNTLLHNGLQFAAEGKTTLSEVEGVVYL